MNENGALADLPAMGEQTTCHLRGGSYGNVDAYQF